MDYLSKPPLSLSVSSQDTRGHVHSPTNTNTPAHTHTHTHTHTYARLPLLIPSMEVQCKHALGATGEKGKCVFLFTGNAWVIYSLTPGQVAPHRHISLPSSLWQCKCVCVYVCVCVWERERTKDVQYVCVYVHLSVEGARWAKEKNWAK